MEKKQKPKTLKIIVKYRFLSLGIVFLIAVLQNAISMKSILNFTGFDLFYKKTTRIVKEYKILKELQRPLRGFIVPLLSMVNNSINKLLTSPFLFLIQAYESMSFRVLPNNSSEDYRVELSNNIAHELNDTEYCRRSKVGQEGVLSRDRVLTKSKLIVMIIKFKSSIQREADRFFKEMSNEDFNIRVVTKDAFTKTRAKLNPWAFKRLNEVAVNTFYEKASYRTWHKKGLLAVDGTRLMLPNHPTIKEEFGEHKFGPKKADSKRSMAMGSVLLAIDSEIAPYDSS